MQYPQPVLVPPPLMPSDHALVTVRLREHRPHRAHHLSTAYANNRTGNEMMNAATTTHHGTYLRTLTCDSLIAEAERHPTNVGCLLGWSDQFRECVNTFARYALTTDHASSAESYVPRCWLFPSCHTFASNLLSRTL